MADICPITYHRIYIWEGKQGKKRIIIIQNVHIHTSRPTYRGTLALEKWTYHYYLYVACETEFYFPTRISSFRIIST
jgi:hypothetical protein